MQLSQNISTSPTGNDMTHDENSINLPQEFNAPAQILLYTRYGDPREQGWANKWITRWNVRERFPWFPVLDFEIHKHFKAHLENALTELVLYDLFTEIKTFDGCYHLRNAKSDNALMSLHAWGAAIDLNAADNPRGCLGKWSDRFLEIMSNNGIFCGQAWEGRKDPMHFAMVNG
jgi:hypothetical protein